MQYRSSPASIPPNRFRSIGAPAQHAADSNIPEAPFSAARLAAEAAFSQSPSLLSPPPNEPLVIVRRAKAIAALVPCAMPALAAHPGTDVDRKQPRVFRVMPAQDGRAEWSEQSADSVLPDASVTLNRRQRNAARKKPGPVLRLYQSPVAQQTEAPAAAPASAQLDAPDRLAEQLALVDVVLASIGRAQSFRLQDEPADLEWRRLTQRADTLLAQLRLQL